MNTIEVHELRKVFPNGHEALKNISFNVAPGEMVAIIGPSGAGKSTLLRCLNGILPATSGRIAINGLDLTSASAQERSQLRRRIGFVYQDYNLVERSQVFRNVISGRLGQMSPLRSVLGLFPQADRLIALECLDRVQLLHKADQRADRLSGGEKQRVSIARALAQQPWLILADEPVASLDPELSHEVMGFLRKAATDHGLPVLVNIHDVVLAQEYADRMLGIAEGQIEFDGRPDALTQDVLRRIYRRDPRTLFFASGAAQATSGQKSQEVAFGDLIN
ncbi:MAG: phosphonate ABC transporter ATP-binding protein [Roseiflexaceae bacterium]